MKDESFIITMAHLNGAESERIDFDTLDKALSSSSTKQRKSALQALNKKLLDAGLCTPKDAENH